MTTRKTVKKIPRKTRAKPIGPVERVPLDKENLRRANATWNGVTTADSLTDGYRGFGDAAVKEEGTTTYTPKTKRDLNMHNQGFKNGYLIGKREGKDEGYRVGMQDNKEANAVKKDRYETVTKLISVTGQTLQTQSEILANLSRIIDGANRS